jgi:hypothetical protein
MNLFISEVYVDNVEFERGISISSETGNVIPTQHFISGEFLSPEQAIARMNRVFENGRVPFKFPRQCYKSSYQNPFQKVYLENMMMEIIREINSSPARVARIVMNKVALIDRYPNSDIQRFRGSSDKKIIIDSYPLQPDNPDSFFLDRRSVRVGKTLMIQNQIQRYIDEMSSRNGCGDEPIRWATPEILKWVGNK